MKNDVSVPNANQLLEEYQPGESFFLASPTRTLLAKGTFSALPAWEGSNQLEQLPARVARFLQEVKESGHGNPIMVGAVPFDGKIPAQLVVPEIVQWSGPLVCNPNPQSYPTIGANYQITSIPQPGEFEHGVEKGLALLKTGELSKVVLSRSLHLTTPEKVDIYQLLRNLAMHNTHGYTFAVDLPEERVLLGASPELLVSRFGMQVIANPLAGSIPRSGDPIEDERRALALLSSAKDLHEHAVVVDQVAATLSLYCRALDVPEKPSLVQTETMWHLSTRITGELSDSLTSSLELASALHPTPAVCGYPTELAREAIHEIEPFDRGYYTGMVGWCDEKGDGEWVVTIRCAEVEEHSMRLFAGAGIVAGSSAEGELRETSAKFRTMLLALGLSHV